MKEEFNKFGKYIDKFTDQVAELLPNLIASVILLLIGLWLIKFTHRIINRVLEKRKFDVSVSNFITDLAIWSLRVVLFIVVASQLGIETTSFVAIIGAVSLAIGMALQGSLANFAGGVLILVFKPFKVGDYISAQDISGTVKNITIFTTTITTDYNQLAFLPNGQLSNEKIINYSVFEHRIEKITFNIHALDDLRLAKELILKCAMAHSKIVNDENDNPRVMVSELAGTNVGILLIYKTKKEDYWDVRWEIMESVKIALSKAGMNGVIPIQEVRVTRES